jgi:hypothetical protein
VAVLVVRMEDLGIMITATTATSSWIFDIARLGLENLGWIWLGWEESIQRVSGRQNMKEGMRAYR